MKKTWIQIIIIVVILAVFTGIHIWLNSRPDAYFNTYGTEKSKVIATTTTQIIKDQSINKDNTNNNSMKNFAHTVTLETNKGTIVFQTYDADAPKTSENFITLASKGFYNGLIFHRVIQGFMIQGGDPMGTGMGGPGYKFADELDPNTISAKTGYVRGTVAMANSGPDTNGSQFFIMHKDTPLPYKYSIFGKVISGMEVVDAIAGVAVDGSDKPIETIKINKVTVK